MDDFPQKSPLIRTVLKQILHFTTDTYRVTNLSNKVCQYAHFKNWAD